MAIIGGGVDGVTAAAAATALGWDSICLSNDLYCGIFGCS